MTYPSKEEVETRNAMDNLFFKVIIALLWGLAVYIAAESYAWFERKTDAAKKVAAETVKQQTDFEKRIGQLEKRVYFPLFTAHCSTCQQCGSDTPTEDGPPALCEKGFEFFKQDMRNNQ